jgi:hypothetical protein
MIFVGEHTSYTHGWIASAIESGVRGGVQLLLGEFLKLSPGGSLVFSEIFSFS